MRFSFGFAVLEVAEALRVLELVLLTELLEQLLLGAPLANLLVESLERAPLRAERLLDARALCAPLADQRVQLLYVGHALALDLRQLLHFALVLRQTNVDDD